jgi:sortase A
MHEIFMEELKKWVVRYPGTAQPWQVGNAFIFWHSSNYPWVKSEYNDIFALLDNLELWDEIIVYYNQKKYIYRVTDRAIVKPGDVKALESRDPNKKELSLMTCWPIGTTLERLIIFAELQENL